MEISRYTTQPNKYKKVVITVDNNLTLGKSASTALQLEIVL